MLVGCLVEVIFYEIPVRRAKGQANYDDNNHSGSVPPVIVDKAVQQTHCHADQQKHCCASVITMLYFYVWAWWRTSAP